MIASVIGKTLLAEYNRRKGTKYSAGEFFENVFHPVFYDHERYLQYVGNSAYVQGLKKGSPYNKTDRLSRLNTLKQKIHSGIAPDASFAIGFAATGAEGTTSGQVTNLSIPASPEDVYASWIGGGLGIGIQGGFSIYFNHPQILWKIYEGWQLYRSFLTERENLRPNQIDTWNGQWFSYACSDEFDEDFPEVEMANRTSATKDGDLEFKTQQWTEVLFGVANKFKTQQITGYVFSLGQMNTTIGFVPFALPELVRPLQFYREFFGENEFLDNKKIIQKMYGTAHSFRSACRKGAIGVPALEPRDLVQYMSSARGQAKKPDFAKADQEKRISFNVYQSWLMAMLNNKDLWQKATDAATAYLEYVAGSKKVSTQRENAIEKVLNATSKRMFIEASTVLVQDSNTSAQSISDLVEEVNALPEDNFRYFQTLIKFRYAFLKSQRQGENQ